MRTRERDALRKKEKEKNPELFLLIGFCYPFWRSVYVLIDLQLKKYSTVYREKNKTDKHP